MLNVGSLKQERMIRIVFIGWVRKTRREVYHESLVGKFDADGLENYSLGAIGGGADIWLEMDFGTVRRLF
jgi:hypothetical protein